tara:strand:+ start:3219 stop:3500 length:282 start_codon:yes stop_codon:yes gene_type:complete
MNNKRKIKKSSQHEKEHNLVNIFKDKFLDLCFRLDNLSDSNPGLVARLLFDLIEKDKEYVEDYIAVESDYIQTVEHIEILLDDLEASLNSTKH